MLLEYKSGDTVYYKGEKIKVINSCSEIMLCSCSFNLAPLAGIVFIHKSLVKPIHRMYASI